MTSTRGLLRDGLWIKQTPSVYSQEQVSRWLAKINYLGDLASLKPSLESLSLLARLSLATFPFENTPMHYTAAHSMDITYEGLYERMVASSAGGSYCFGLNGLFFQMIKALGFRAYSGAGRINEQGPGVEPVFHAFVHRVLFVQPIAGSNVTYIVDTGDGTGLVRPMLLADGGIVEGASPTEQHRLTLTARADSSLESSPNSPTAQKFEWRLESLHAAKDAGRPPTARVMYSFIEDEFFDEDYRASNYHVLGLTEGLFWENVMCIRSFFMSDDEVRSVDPSVDPAALTPLTRYLGRLTMAGSTVRRYVGMQTTVLREMKTEEERAEALREFFGISIPQEDLESIRGRGAELVQS
ncbi:arylamine N-acetyltransferase 1 [Mycena pura]|uniref:Arylamine N-acetyltransferase 1 n=1 Tax=Mycena pura TaxID=153505 RepID=A0AAD6VJ45_9AGAR|nr:arylamine N-acetyltransferase 1 [Mycena pura]